MSVSAPTQQRRQPRIHRQGLRISWLLAAACVLANILWILASGETRDLLTTAGVLLFFAASLTHSLSTRGAAWSAGFFGIACVFGWTVEAVGTATGLPFGAYCYTDRLGWSVASVPALIPLAWAMMAYPVFTAVARTAWSRPARIVLAAALLASWDLFLDPQMVAEGHWVWAQPEPALPGIPGIPISNFAGWVAAAVVLMTLLTLALPPRTQAPIAQPTALLAWVYAGNVVANAVFLGRPAVAAIGAIVMGVPMAVLTARLRNPAEAPRRDQRLETAEARDG